MTLIDALLETLNLNAVILARVQFAFTISFHIIFPAFTIGLASWLAVVEWRYLKTRNTIYKEIYTMWVKIFAITFGMGVVSGVVMSYQFGTNWAVFSDKVGNVIGPLLGYEVLTAFFLEASFLGIMLFGWNRVSERMHFFSTVIVAIGTLISAFWILSANSWMQTPQGFRVDSNGILFPTSWVEIVFNPSFPYRFLHMITAAYLTTAFAIAGVASFYLWRHRHIIHAKKMLGMAMIMAVFVSPIQIFLGDLHGLNTLKHQPAKVAAMEGLWETQQRAPLKLIGWPDSAQEKTLYSLEIPGLASLILTHDINGTVQGLKEWKKADRPPVVWVFWSFRVMVAIGLLMALTGVFATLLFFRKKLFTTRWFQVWCMCMTPSGFVAVLAGWFVTEIGRQPFIAYGVIRTSDAISPVISPYIALSLLAFIVSYTIIFAAGVYYILQLILKGPKNQSSEPALHGIEKTLVDSLLPKENDKKNV